jgi:protein-L-isoaspartate(D-aspartate) O-methyltransferase
MNVRGHDDPQVLQDALIDAIRHDAQETAFWTGRSQFSDAVMAAMARTPRHAFIPASQAVSLHQAYANRPQPIGHGQTISQPYIVALMTDLLDLKGGERVLEVGAGCGYQSAVLANMGCDVFAIERIQPLADLAAKTLAKLGFETVTITCADGAKGWAEFAPFDAILVSACLDGPIPPELIDQLRPGARLVIPLGLLAGPQMLHLGVKDARGRFTHSPVLPVSFVPLVTKTISG